MSEMDERTPLVGAEGVQDGEAHGGDQDADEVMDFPAPEDDVAEPDAASEALIEQFLAETSGEVVRDPTSEVASAWPEALPEGHRSGFVALIGSPRPRGRASWAF
jgi:hypothetical protein